MAANLSPSPFSVGEFFEECTDGAHTESVDVDVSEVEPRPSVLAGGEVRADLQTCAATEASHLQDRCVDLATELFVLKNKVDEQAKQLKWARREADAREKDFREVKRVCDEESLSSRTFMRKVKIAEEANRKLQEQNADLKIDKERLLGVLRRHKEAGLSESFCAHRDRLRKRRMTEKEVNKCDLASTRLAVKATRQENGRLLRKARGQENRIQALEEAAEELVRQLDQAKETVELTRAEADLYRQQAEELKASEQRAKSDMEHEALLKLEAIERAAEVEKAESEARQARVAAERETETLRAELQETTGKLNENHTSRRRHQGSFARYQSMIDAQASALQAAREQLLGEKVRRQEAERQARLQHIAKIDSKTQAAAAVASGRRMGISTSVGIREQQRHDRRLVTPSKTRK